MSKIFGDGIGNWQIHLGASATLVLALAQAWIAPVTPCWEDLPIGHENSPEDESIINTEYNAAIPFLLGFFISIDILSCASTRSSHFLELDHKFILERSGIRLENLTGCENWAIVFIFEISLLDKWKRDLETTHQLNIIELGKRGSQIEERLQQRLASINECLIGSFSGYTSGLFPTYTCTEITRVFAFSAMTYLHVVISGDNPELPEIKKSVSNTVDAFKSLTDAKLLRHLAWPFCVSGCLALNEHHADFQDLAFAAEITEYTVGACLEAFKIVKKCWGVRRTGSNDCDWTSVMESQDRFILLV